MVEEKNNNSLDQEKDAVDILVDGQDELKNHKVGGRNITLDVHAIDVNGEEIDIEVQGNPEGAHIRRARYHSSMVDLRMLQEGREQMCEAVEKYGDERAIKAKIISVQNLMKNTKFTLEQALNALGIQGDERELIAKQLQK